MIVNKIDVYNDGGTILIDTDEGVYYVDNRIDSNTKKELYYTYPDEGNKIEEPLVSVLKRRIYKAMSYYTGQFYSKEYILMLMNDLK